MKDFEHVGVRLPKDIIKDIDKLAEDKLSTQSQIMREAIKKGLPLIK